MAAPISVRCAMFMNFNVRKNIANVRNLLSQNQDIRKHLISFRSLNHKASKGILFSKLLLMLFHTLCVLHLEIIIE